MTDLIRKRFSLWLLLLILIVFIGLLIYNETHILRSDKTHTFDEALDKQLNNDALHTKEVDQKFKDASNNDVRQAMAIHSKDSDFIYMDISEPVPMNKEEVDDILKSKGVFKGKGDVFLKAQEKYQVNVIYLISHALHETGNGHSKLANGIKVDGKTYYNFFGIGAFDANALKTGSSYSKKAEWTSVDKAILGGAKFIRKNYFDKGQLTLYQMRWNPKSPGENQYASDIHWGDRIASFMEKPYEKLGIKKDHIRKDYYKETKH
ncbi:N-acetylglucosaminidase [Staphylococcus massiliensis]|uniref:N-acetylglucosaminidase n=1 Tax=Staphylococcus massiliensis TaxID=555791 RepID=UPI0002DE344B|nr:N-acetylglucosaminidase [Staphylococcus massiliensis]MCG3399420.1 N-acetylglucosaminidase [Staphylococcus massiliensis]MCG3411556.1 N-acetylglucosaminidase [Staphylococcus massiliensis]PNZ98709.1 autolysin [Staphylococcus massiliensis CCUG 55927]